MQKKTITRNIAKKMDSWLSTITDEALRKDIKANLLVSGGSITSMFLNEPVNDYDVYIQKKSVLLRLAQYYVQPLNEQILDGADRDALIKKYYLSHHGVSEKEFESKKCQDWLEEDVSEYVVRLKNLKPDQVRLNIPSDGIKYDVPEDEKEAGLYKVVFISPNAISLTDNLQIVLRFSGTVEEIHKNFDFIHATNYYTTEDGVVTNLAALESLISKDLKYQGSLYPLTSMIRIKKFVRRGWTINAGEMLKIMFQVSLLDLQDPEVLEEQLLGIDVAFFAKLIDILRGVEKEKMTPSYLNTIIDRVFNQYEESDE